LLLNQFISYKGTHQASRDESIDEEEKDPTADPAAPRTVPRLPRAILLRPTVTAASANTKEQSGNGHDNDEGYAYSGTHCYADVVPTPKSPISE